jgi:hypothetical protein
MNSSSSSSLFFFLFFLAKCFHSYEERREEEGMKVKYEGNSQNRPLLDMYLKKSAHPLFGACSLLLVHVWFTPCQGPKSFQNMFFRNWNMEV